MGVPDYHSTGAVAGFFSEVATWRVRRVVDALAERGDIRIERARLYRLIPNDALAAIAMELQRRGWLPASSRATPEGDDKPTKYPATVSAVDLLVVTKVDLLPHVPFDVERCVMAARRVKPDLPVLLVSAVSGEGMDAWMDWVGPGAA